MRKLLFAAVVLLASTQVSSAITIEGGIGGWKEDPTGWVEYKGSATASSGTVKTHVDLEDDLHLSDKTRLLAGSRLNMVYLCFQM